MYGYTCSDKLLTIIPPKTIPHQINHNGCLYEMKDDSLVIDMQQVLLSSIIVKVSSKDFYLKNDTELKLMQPLLICISFFKNNPVKWMSRQESLDPSLRPNYIDHYDNYGLAVQIIIMCHCYTFQYTNMSCYMYITS